MESSFYPIEIASNFFRTVLFITGIPGIPKFTKQKSFDVLRVAFIVLFHLGIAYILILYTYDLEQCVDFQCKKVIFSRIVWRVCILITYHMLRRKKHRTQKIISVFLKVGHQHYSIMQTHTFIVNVATTSFLVVCLITIAVVFGLFANYSSITNLWFHELTFRSHISCDFNLKLIVVFCYFVITRLLVVAVCILTTISHVTFNISLGRFISQCKTKLNHSIDSKNGVLNFVRDYNAIHKLAMSAESAFSVPVFWLWSSHFVEIFASFSNLLGFHSNAHLVYIVEKIIITPLNLVSLFSIPYFASEVCREDEKLRKRAKEMSFYLRMSKETEIEKSGEFLMRFIKSKEKIMFSALGAFYFTRTFLLTSVGVLITYNLLILQLNVIDEDEIF